MLNPLQERLLKMLIWFHHYCEENHLIYYVVAGTMLGAARHQGFIPWDDDIDVGMPREDYDKLMKIFVEKEGNYILETPYMDAKDYVYSYCKLYDTTTSMTELTRKNCNRGIFIDIFPIDGIGNSKNEVARNYRKIDILNMFLAMRTCAIRKERKWYKNLAIRLARIIPDCIINEKKIARKIDYECSRRNMKQNAYCGNLMSTYRAREIIKTKLYGTPTLYKFENTMIYGVQDYEKYLSHLYGDWRKLPPEEQRNIQHDFINLDLNKPYLYEKYK